MFKGIEKNINSEIDCKNLIESLCERSKRFSLVPSYMESNPYYVAGNIFRIALKTSDSQRLVFGINFESTKIFIMFWFGSDRITSQEFMDLCPETYKDIFLFNLNLIA